MEKYVGVSAVLNSENQIEIASERNSKTITRNFDFDLEDNLLAGIYAFSDEFYPNFKLIHNCMGTGNYMIAFLERKDEN